VHGDQRDDQLRCVPERRVEEPADARPGVLCGVLGRLADQPREGDERDRGEHELGGLVEVGEVVQRDRERADEQAAEEDAADHERQPYPRSKACRHGSYTVATRAGLPVSIRDVKSCATAAVVATIRA